MSNNTSHLWILHEEVLRNQRKPYHCYHYIYDFFSYIYRAIQHFIQRVFNQTSTNFDGFTSNDIESTCIKLSP